MRGKPPVTRPRSTQNGITPAGAGKTTRKRGREKALADHPRRCGENSCNIFCRNATFGITPAGAGKTLIDEIQTEFNRDHPRRCGENLAAIAEVLGCRGSPPQVRGKLSVSVYFALPMRITPAGAGKTYICKLIGRAGKDHPRRCGENLGIFLSL